MSGFVTGSIKDKSAKVFKASKAEPSSTKKETTGKGVVNDNINKSLL